LEATAEKDGGMAGRATQSAYTGEETPMTRSITRLRKPLVLLWLALALIAAAIVVWRAWVAKTLRERDAHLRQRYVKIAAAGRGIAIVERPLLALTGHSCP
jgi:hypothetical protein